MTGIISGRKAIISCEVSHLPVNMPKHSNVFHTYTSFPSNRKEICQKLENEKSVKRTNMVETMFSVFINIKTK